MSVNLKDTEDIVIRNAMRSAKGMMRMQGFTSDIDKKLISNKKEWLAFEAELKRIAKVPKFLDRLDLAKDWVRRTGEFFMKIRKQSGR